MSKVLVTGIHGCIAFLAGGALVSLNDGLWCKVKSVALFVLQTPKITPSVSYIRVTARILSHVEITHFEQDSSNWS